MTMTTSAGSSKTAKHIKLKHLFIPLVLNMHYSRGICSGCKKTRSRDAIKTTWSLFLRRHIATPMFVAAFSTPQVASGLRVIACSAAHQHGRAKVQLRNAMWSADPNKMRNALVAQVASMFHFTGNIPRQCCSSTQTMFNQLMEKDKRATASFETVSATKHTLSNARRKFILESWRLHFGGFDCPTLL